MREETFCFVSLFLFSFIINCFLSSDFEKIMNILMFYCNLLT